MNRVLFFIFSLLLTVISLLGCSRQDKGNPSPAPTVAQGTEDAGGGSITKSSPEQVHAALDLALALASEPVAQKNIFVQFWTDWGRNSKHEFIAVPEHLFPRMAAELKAGRKYTPVELQSKFSSPFFEALKRNTVNRLEKGNCLLVGTDHKDASVSKFATDADLCFSVGNLQEVPPSALVQEILSLILHEVTHLGGNRDEVKAAKWQTEFSTYFGARFGDLTTDTISVRTKKKIADAKSLLQRAAIFAKNDPRDARLYIKVAKASEIVATIPAFLDPLAIKLKVRPTRPELIDNYANAVLVFLEKAREDFAFQSANLPLVIPFFRPATGGGIVPSTIPIDKVVPPEKVEAAIIELDLSLTLIEQNFLALSDLNAKSACVLPKGQLNLGQFDTNQMGLEDSGRVQLPATECAPGTRN